METIYETIVPSALGQITVRASGRGIREVALGRRDARPADPCVKANGQKSPGAHFAKQAALELQEYAAGTRREFTVPLDPQGTPFQKRVWRALSEIPYGETRSYGEVARQVGNPKAARAVGMANHYNPLALIVPCHRVIASDGSLGGYACGLKKKSEILKLEKKHL